MITDSYSASCYVENKDGQYHMECEMVTGDKEIYSDYDGNSFVDGLNEIMADMTAQMLKVPEPKPEPKPQTPEERLEYLEGLVKDLQNENADLLAQIKNSTTKDEKLSSSVDDAVKKFEDVVDKIVNNNKENYYKPEQLKTTGEPSTLRWPFTLYYI